MRIYVFAAVLCVRAAAFSPLVAEGAVGPSVRDIVEFTSIVQPQPHDADALRRQTSPDGKRAFIVTRQGKVASDTNRYQILMLDLDPHRLALGKPAPPDVVFTFDAKFDDSAGYVALVEVQWANDRMLLFRAKISNEIFQVYSLDLETRQLVQLTHAPLSVTSFAASRDLKRLVYATRVPSPPMRPGERSIVVGNQWARSVLYGRMFPNHQISKFAFYVQDVGQGSAPRPLGEPFFLTNLGLPVANISPDGRWAILPRYERDRARAWSQQYPLLGEAAEVFGPAMKRDPLGYFTGSMGFTARRMVAWRLDEAREQPILDAPDDALMGGGQLRPDKVWQPSGKSVVLAGTHLPLVDGQQSTASHVIEYWPDSGRWTIVARLKGRLDSALGDGDRLDIVDGATPRRFQRTDGDRWREVVPAVTVAPDAAAASGARSAWTLDIQQALNQPADAVARSPSGQTVRLTTLNPQYDAKTWGAMSVYAWRDSQGRPWQGGLLTPSDAVQGKRLPLVIQTYVFDPKSFYLDGPNRGLYSSAYPGRALSREGMLVLGMPFRPEAGTVKHAADENRVFNDGVKSVVDALVREGRVDPDRIGIIGFSATGSKVMNLITFSGLPVRAATLADGDSDTLFSYALGYGFADVKWGYREAINGGIPAGPDLATWVARDPSLHTDCVKTALRIESYGTPITNHWDIYSMMRRQYKPVEMILIPDGTHALAMPGERMISLQGNVDWFRFWLQGAKRDVLLLAAETPSSLRAQYKAWEQMAAMKQADDERPRCPVKAVG